ncbi:hypothetical protein B9Z55_019502 [Caenorhabditis nigoni]|uniref:CX domain-containing protein n=1 Tax=Caenorhabditis nigoni TaxID=1611254 RepID=A0A2G5TIQ1_9PELO|nr:hypothetical protein B9Z55_019502 [Caenorhabditis nigoni]
MKLFIFLTLICSDVIARGGGGRGGGGGGRGFGGARAAFGRGGGFGRGAGIGGWGVSGKSVFAGTSRSGIGGWKTGSSSPASSYGSSSFRSTIFAPSFPQTYLTHSALTSALIISTVRPIPYDNRLYYWNSSQARERMSPVEYSILCEYEIGPDDGQLQNVTYENGSHPRSLFFGCRGSMVDCCGMYCCHNTGEYVMMGLLFVGVIVFVCVALCGSCAEEKHWSRQYVATNRAPGPSNTQGIPMVKVSRASTSYNSRKS